MEALGQPIQRGWNYLLDNYPIWQIDIMTATAVQISCFWIPCYIYYAIEHYLPKFSQRHRIQPNVRTTWADIKEGLRVVFRNQLINTSLQLLSLYLNALANKPPAVDFSRKLPGLVEVVTQVIICHLIREALFYYSHRFLHKPKLYPKIHKIHHKFTAPVALAAQYAHPIEHLVANILPTALPPMLLKSHAITNLAFQGSVLLETTLVHSGFDFFGNFAKKHDLHHEKFIIYFGVYGILDKFHGTDLSRLEKRRKKAP